MRERWKDKLFAAVKADGRSERALSLAAGLGPNFVNQLRGTAAKPPKDPSVLHLAKLAQELGISMAYLFSDAAPAPVVRTKVDTDPEILALLARIEGLSNTDINIAFAIIANARTVKMGAQGPSAPDGQSPPASRRRVSAPSG